MLKLVINIWKGIFIFFSLAAFVGFACAVFEKNPHTVMRMKAKQANVDNAGVDFSYAKGE